MLITIQEQVRHNRAVNILRTLVLSSSARFGADMVMRHHLRLQESRYPLEEAEGSCDSSSWSSFLLELCAHTQEAVFTVLVGVDLVGDGGNGVLAAVAVSQISNTSI
jgi:hypothetical protein